MNPDATKFLETKCTGPVSVVSVGGRYRGGKSFLLNRAILDNAQAFGVGSTTRACTKGIWLYPKTVQSIGTIQPNIGDIVVVDTEGIAALDTDPNHDCRIFSLALLLSSVFLYNSTGPIDETAIQSLGLVLQVVRDLEIACGDDLALEQVCGSFIWVARDFSLKMEDKWISFTHV